jgi:hypothetical protein
MGWLQRTLALTEMLLQRLPDGVVATDPSPSPALSEHYSECCCHCNLAHRIGRMGPVVGHILLSDVAAIAIWPAGCSGCVGPAMGRTLPSPPQLPLWLLQARAGVRLQPSCWPGEWYGVLLPDCCPAAGLMSGVCVCVLPPGSCPAAGRVSCMECVRLGTGQTCASG